MDFYEEYQNNFYTPLEKAGQNENWKAIEKAFHKVESELATPFIVTFTNIPTDQDALAGVVDKTEEEIREAHEAGRQIVGHYVSEQLNYDFYAPIETYGFVDGRITISISTFGVLNNVLMYIRLYTDPEPLSMKYDHTQYVISVG